MTTLGAFVSDPEPLGEVEAGSAFRSSGGTWYVHGGYGLWYRLLPSGERSTTGVTNYALNLPGRLLCPAEVGASDDDALITASTEAAGSDVRWSREHGAPSTRQPLTRQVHDHGPSEGRGTLCPEKLVDGARVGYCMRPEAWGHTEPAPPPETSPATGHPSVADQIRTDLYALPPGVPAPSRRTRRQDVTLQLTVQVDGPTALALLARSVLANGEIRTDGVPVVVPYADLVGTELTLVDLEVGPSEINAYLSPSGSTELAELRASFRGSLRDLLAGSQPVRFRA